MARASHHGCARPCSSTPRLSMHRRFSPWPGARHAAWRIAVVRAGGSPQWAAIGDRGLAHMPLSRPEYSWSWGSSCRVARRASRPCLRACSRCDQRWLGDAPRRFAHTTPVVAVTGHPRPNATVSLFVAGTARYCLQVAA